MIPQTSPVSNEPRVAVVTGAGSGIGAATSLTLAGAGWTVVVAGRRSEPLEEVVSQAAWLPGQVHSISADVTQESSVRLLFDQALVLSGRIDLLFNNAGMSAPEDEIDQVSLDSWNAVVAVNLTGAFLCGREAFRVMRRQQPQGGRIINSGSLSAHVPRPRSAAYAATKHAISGLTKALILDGRPYNIASGQIDIGNAATAMADPMGRGVIQPGGERRQEPRIDVQDVARAVLYMASLPLGANVPSLTVMSTTMPYSGRG